MRLVTLPGVFRPRSDAWLLAAAMREHLPPAGAVLDLCTGSGVLAVAAARAGGRVTAVDVSRRAIVCARLNARLNGVRIRALRGDLLAPVAGERFDAVVSNPPYLPAADDHLPRHGAARAWQAGREGRALLDRLCDEAPEHLRPGGTLMLVQSSVSGESATLERLRRAGLESEVVARHRGPLGPLLAGRVAVLEARGLLEPGQREEEILVVRAVRPG